MKPPNTPKQNFDDDDMQSLFDKESVRVPSSLDDIILKAAHEAVESDATPSPVINNQSDYSWRQYWPQGLAAACVVGLAVVLVPVIMSSPESQLSETDIVGVSVDSEAMAVEEMSEIDANGAIATSRSRETLRPREAEIPQTPKLEMAPMADTVEIVVESEPVNDTSTLRQQAKTAFEASTARTDRADSGVTADAEAPADSEPLYRKTSDDWVKEILRLYDNDDTEAARQEFSLFAKRHPEHPFVSRLQEEIRD